ncbi:MAG: DNA mismatch repair endonuclease MutL [Clostridiales bacterium]|nr:DNA mismatch repair endonuclease MutL [Clostridiales bacterium]
MQMIRVLPPQIADKIAAGEVVERPGSVVKELVENAIDAGASALTVEIQHGGMSYIRVTDNGAGMSGEDAETAFLRHATSKLSDERGLEAITTLGFRGEALAAISAVSRISLLSRTKGREEGIALSLEAGRIVERSPAGCPEGTTMVIRDLFFNTPARLKFMKKDTAEAAHVTTVIIRAALSHPEVAFTYIKDGKTELTTPGDGDVRSSIYTLLGRDFARTMIEIKSGDKHLTLGGFIASPSEAKGNRSAQFFFLNGRSIRSPLLQAALEQGYKNSLFTGRFPGCVLYLTVKPNTVDVNVHPAKTEVRFQNERAVFDIVYYAVRSALEENIIPNELRLEANDKNNALETENRQPEEPSSTETKAYRPYTPTAHIVRDVPVVYGKAPVDRPPFSPKTAPEYIQESLNVFEHSPSDENIQEIRLPRYRIIGEAFGGYIIAEKDDELVIIDKHAAHERQLFDRLKNRERTSMPQLLLTPHVAEISREDKQTVLANPDVFKELGFVLEDFGGSAVLIRQIPAELDIQDAAGILGELCQCLGTGDIKGALGREDEMLSKIACKASIKIGKNSEPSELIPLVNSVLSGKIKFCPHGRPVSMTIGKNQLEKGFKRK